MKKIQILSLIYGSYTDNKRIYNLIYLCEDNKKMIQLLRMFYHLISSQCYLLKVLINHPSQSVQEILQKLKVRSAITYSNIQSLKKQELITNTQI